MMSIQSWYHFDRRHDIISTYVILWYIIWTLNQCLVYAGLWKMFLNWASFSIIRNWFFRIDGKLVNLFLRHNLGYKKYMLFVVNKFVLVLSKFRLIQQSLSRTTCWIRNFNCFKITIKWNLAKSHATWLKPAKCKTHMIKTMPIKGALSDLRQFLATERRLKMMRNSFYFLLKVFFVLKIFFVLSFWPCIKMAWLER